MSNLKYNDITDSITKIKLKGNLNEEFNLNPFKKKVPSYDEISDSLSRSASKARSLPNVTFEPDRTVMHDIMDKLTTSAPNLPKVSIPGGLAAGAYSFKGKDMSLNPNFVKAMDARNNKLLPRGLREKSLTEDGHTDVPSSIRMSKTIMEDAHDILCALCNTDMDEEIDTWWTNKLAVAASTLNKLRDYYVHEVDHEGHDEVDMEIEEQRGGPRGAGGFGPSSQMRPLGRDTRVPDIDGGNLTSVRNTRSVTPPTQSPSNFFGLRMSNKVGTGRGATAAAAAGALGGALVGSVPGEKAKIAARQAKERASRRPDVMEQDMDLNISRKAKTPGYIKVPGGFDAPVGPSAEGIYNQGQPLSINPEYIDRVNRANSSRNKQMGLDGVPSLVDKARNFMKPGGPLAPRGYSGVLARMAAEREARERNQ